MRNGKVLTASHHHAQIFHRLCACFFYYLHLQPHVEDTTIGKITDELNRQGYLPSVQFTSIYSLVAILLTCYRAMGVIEELQSVRFGLIDSSVLRALKAVQTPIDSLSACWSNVTLYGLMQLLVKVDWPKDDTFTPPTSPIHSSTHHLRCSSQDWVDKFGIDSESRNTNYTLIEAIDH